MNSRLEAIKRIGVDFLAELRARELNINAFI